MSLRFPLLDRDFFQRVPKKWDVMQSYRPRYDTLLLTEEKTGRPICAVMIRPKEAEAAAAAPPFAALRALPTADGSGGASSGVTNPSSARFQALMSMDK